ncbi:MAG: helix-turn-helix domain-containing protein [Oscillospiraceae bacterium]
MTIRQQMKLLCTCLCRQDELYAAVSKRHGLSYHTAMTLYALDQDEGCTQKEIAKTWLIPKQTVNTVVKELERQGYVFFQTGKRKSRFASPSRLPAHAFRSSMRSRTGPWPPWGKPASGKW